MKKTSRFFAFIFLVIVVSCIPKTQSDSFEGSFNIEVDANHLNKQLIVFAPSGWNNFTTTDVVSLEVNAKGKDLISFKPEDVILFIKDGDKWIPVKNKMETSPTGFEYVLDPLKSNDPMFIGTTMILPDLSDKNTDVVMRVFVFGYVYNNGNKTDEKVGAYTDIKLSPR